MPPERLTPLDASFLYLERPAMHMHVAGLSVFDPSSRPGGRLRFDEVESTIASRIHMVPRLRQKVRMVPFHLNLPVWIDDPTFDLDFHLRRVALPAPGGRRELAEFTQRVLSRRLDRTKPLWELYVIEGLEGGHIATLMKVHHAMIDGISGVHLVAALWDLTPDSPRLPPAPVWKPEPEPSDRELMRVALEEGWTHPMRALMDAAEFARQQPAVAAISVGSALSGVRSILDLGARPTSPLDVRIGSNRRFAMAEAPVQRFKDVKNALGGTVNDVVLTAVAGALHRWFRARREPTKDRTLRVMVPVSVRVPGDARLGNRVAAAARAASRGPWFNLVVSNIPGPQQPLYLAGARLVASYPSMPLGENSALSVACTSLAGTMAFGLTGDWDSMHDLDALALALEDSVAELAKAAGI